MLARPLAAVVWRSGLSALMCAALALLLLAAAFQDYGLYLEFRFLRTRCLVAWIVAGGAAALCLAGAMACVNRILARPDLRRPWRLALRLAKRGILVAQLLATALALVSAGALVLDRPIPSPDDNILFPGWSPPDDTPPPRYRFTM